MAERAARALAALAFSLILASVIGVGVAVNAQEGPVDSGPFVKYEYDEDNQTITVHTPFYKAVIDLKRGGGLVELTTYYNGSAFNFLSGTSRYLPAIFPYVYSNTSNLGPGSAVIELIVDNKTVTTSYPGYLATRPWVLASITETASFIKVTLQPSKEAAVDVEPLNITVIYTFYSYKPIITYKIAISNSANEPVSLYSFEINDTQYGLVIEIVAGDDMPHLWNYTFSYVGKDGNVTRISTNDPQVDIPVDANKMALGPYFSIIRLQGLENDTVGGDPLYALVVIPVEGAPSAASLLRGYVDEVKNTIRIRLLYPSAVLMPGEALEYTINVIPAPFDAVYLAAAGAVDYYYTVSKEFNTTLVYNSTAMLSRLKSKISELENTVSDLRDQVSELREQLDKARSDVDGYKELYSTCQVELSMIKDRLAVCLSRVDRTAAIGLVGLIVGVLLGLLGYRLVFEKMGVTPSSMVKMFKEKRRG